MSLVKKNNFDELIDNVYPTHCVLQENATKAINFNLTVRNWLVGCYIVEYEQNGEDRAKYGDKLIDEMAKRLKSKGLKGFVATSLRLFRTFYLQYPQIQQTLSVELQKSGINADKLLSINTLQIQPTVSVELPKAYPISTEILLSRLSFSHFIELFRADDELERLFYEVETIKNNWSVRELKRAINTSLAFS